MIVFVGRNGEEIGSFPRDQLDVMARTGAVQPTDYYWHEGMEGWLPLPNLIGEDAWQKTPEPVEAPPAATHPKWPILPDLRLTGRAVAIGAAFLVALSAAIYFIVHDPADSEMEQLQAALTAVPPPLSVARRLEVRNEARDDLKQRIERLPGRAEPPLNTFYYDVAVHMRQNIDPRTPWTAHIRGGEQVVDPATGETIRRTQFTLTADYHEGEWFYRRYQASTSELGELVISEVQHNEHDPAPPSIVGMLGLKFAPPPLLLPGF